MSPEIDENSQPCWLAFGTDVCRGQHLRPGPRTLRPTADESERGTRILRCLATASMPDSEIRVRFQSHSHDMEAPVCMAGLSKRRYTSQQHLASLTHLEPRPYVLRCLPYTNSHHCVTWQHHHQDSEHSIPSPSSLRQLPLTNCIVSARCRPAVEPSRSIVWCDDESFPRSDWKHDYDYGRPRKLRRAGNRESWRCHGGPSP
ncbi:hypothetical protein DOTSEDRAFT_69355 [Dothistroma septosporum NZE10]|uniref:Uncharacterized protein n=1 Tax=Dothistroma septosporum (strain NZE10 / CBS 128990) TaxID=675120 RepID=N1PYR7_DOTSN|nr:hypothetical protein DOTSEDRAFT_69355 [Dothistroma septosporum NZE10]